MPNSVTSVTTSTSLATLAMSPRRRECVSTWVISFARNGNDRLTMSPSRVAAVIMPKPPIWNRVKMTH